MTVTHLIDTATGKARSCAVTVMPLLVAGMRAKVRKAIRTVMSRTTSKLEDESLVFMTLTELWAGQYHAFLAPTPQQSC
jgi:hypothetical protein